VFATTDFNAACSETSAESPPFWQAGRIPLLLLEFRKRFRAWQPTQQRTIARSARGKESYSDNRQWGFAELEWSAAQVDLEFLDPTAATDNRRPANQ
jgi:hypothetical protein